MPSKQRLYVVGLFVCHACLLLLNASRTSPVGDEPGHLVAGISLWRTGRFDLYRVNPPLVRALSTLPIAYSGRYQWPDELKHYNNAINSRPVFELGRRFFAVNQQAAFDALIVSRCVSILFSLLGAWVCYSWAASSSPRAGLVALTLWTFSPAILGHGCLITPDIAGCAVGLLATYRFYLWIEEPTWSQAMMAGVCLGLAWLCKSTQLFLVPAWVLTWLWIALLLQRRTQTATRLGKQSLHLFGMFVVAILVLNCGYGFEGSCSSLQDYRFLSGLFQDLQRVLITTFDPIGAYIPVPCPANFMHGMDIQRRNLEGLQAPSYLLGELANTGWWYYYLFGLLVKTPLGTLGLLFAAITTLGWRRLDLRDVVLLTNAIVIFVLVSSQTGFSHHLRYVFPMLPFAFVWIAIRVTDPTLWMLAPARRVLLTLTIGASVWCLPHSISFFNSAVGGPLRGDQYLIYSNVDWGQDLFALKDWISKHEEAPPVNLAYFGGLHPSDLDVHFRDIDAPYLLSEEIPPGVYALSVNLLRGMPWLLPTADGGYAPRSGDFYSGFLELVATDHCGYSIRIYEIQ